VAEEKRETPNQTSPTITTVFKRFFILDIEFDKEYILVS